MDLTQNNLFTFLKESNFAPNLMKDSNQISFIAKVKEFEIPFFFAIRNEGALLQIIAYLSFQMREQTMGEVAKMLHFINKQLDMPGFGMDESAKLMFFRCAVPTNDKLMDKPLILGYISAMQVAIGSFIHSIGMVVAGSATVDALSSKGVQS